MDRIQRLASVACGVALALVGSSALAQEQAPKYTNAEVVKVRTQERLLVIKNTDGVEQTLQLDDHVIKRAEAKLAEAITELSKTSRHKTYLVEARIAMSRVLMERYVRQPQESYPRVLLDRAESLLVQAHRENADSNGVPENNKIEAIIDFALARIKIKQGLRDDAEALLTAGSARLPVIDSDGVKRLYEYARRELDDSPLNFQVSNDLNLSDNVNALKRLIFEKARKEEKTRGQKAWDIIGLSRSQYFDVKKEIFPKPDTEDKDA